MDNKCFISKLLKGFVVMSIHVTCGIKRKKDRSHSGLLLSLQAGIIQKPRFSEKPRAPQTRWLCRAEKAMDLLSIFASTVETPKGTILEMGCYTTGSFSNFYTQALEDPSGDKPNLPTLQQRLLVYAKEIPLKYDGISAVWGAWSSVR